MGFIGAEENGTFEPMGFQRSVTEPAAQYSVRDSGIKVYESVDAVQESNWHRNVSSDSSEVGMDSAWGRLVTGDTLYEMDSPFSPQKGNLYTIQQEGIAEEVELVPEKC